MSEGSFVLDANIFIEAHRRYYGLDLCPGFWESLRHFARQGRVVSIDRVYRELEKGDDALWDWARDFPDVFVSSAAPEIVETFSEIMEWVSGKRQFGDEAISEFADAADGWVAAYARVHGAIVVTHERHDPNLKKRVPLGNVCDKFDLPVEDTFGMLRELHARFGWERSSRP